MGVGEMEEEEEEDGMDGVELKRKEMEGELTEGVKIWEGEERREEEEEEGRGEGGE